jgi:putative transposase
MPAGYRPFQGLDAYRPVQVYRRNMPHWRQDGATYFVTFRLADSIPHATLEAWRGERQRWCATHGLAADLSETAWAQRYRGIPPGVRDEFERRQARALFVELDCCHGECWLRRSACTDVVSQALRHFDAERCQCGDFVIMPNHVHWVV